MDRSPYISIIIPSFESKGIIRKCLMGVLSQDYPAEKIEVIVVDSGHDGTQEICKSLNVQCLGSSKRLTAGEARNLGISHSKGDLIATLDCDNIPPIDWLKKVVTDLYEYPDAGGVYCPMGGGTNYFTKWLNHEYDFNRKALYYSFNGAEAGLSLKKEVISSGARFGESPQFEGLNLYNWMNERGIPILIDNNVRILHLKKVRIASWMKRNFLIGRNYAINKGVYTRGLFMSILVALSLFALPFTCISFTAFLPTVLTMSIFTYYEIVNKIRYNRLAPFWVKLTLGLVDVICKWIFWIGYLIQILFKTRVGYYEG